MTMTEETKHYMEEEDFEVLLLESYGTRGGCLPWSRLELGRLQVPVLLLCAVDTDRVCLLQNFNNGNFSWTKSLNQTITHLCCDVNHLSFA